MEPESLPVLHQPLSTPTIELPDVALEPPAPQQPLSASTFVSELHRPAPTSEAIQEWLVTHLAERLEVEPDYIDIREPFNNYNLDSAEVLVLAASLEEWLGQRLSPTLLWNYPTIELLAERLAEDTESATSAS
ncbi:MAG: acyl carrier protein [Chloroflexota bacterium]|nr:acyl carrier protein [Chloroflexota bacterium]